MRRLSTPGWAAPAASSRGARPRAGSRFDRRADRTRARGPDAPHRRAAAAARRSASVRPAARTPSPSPASSPASGQAATSDASLTAQLAYADVPGAAPAESALAAISPSLPAVVLAPGELSPPPPLPFPWPRSSTTRATLRASRRSQRPRTTRPGEWRWNGRRCAPTRIHPSRSLPPFSKPIRPGPAAARFATGRKANWPRVPRLRPRSLSFAGGAPQTSAGKIAAARAAKAMGRNDEASRTIRALWRDGNFDALTEGVILRDFGARS